MFTYVKEVISKKDKKFFIEKIDLFVRLMEVLNDQNSNANLYSNKKDSKTIKTLKDLNLINSEEDIVLIKEIIKKDKFTNLIKAINFFHNLKDGYDYSVKKFIPAERKKIMNDSHNAGCFKVVDFFCGAGGLSLGFKRENFIIDFANDFEDVCIETYKFNNPQVDSNRIVCDDIKNIIKNIKDYELTNIDVVIGGPPCQGFSSANQQRLIDDPRNHLYKDFIKAISYISPKFVLMENVRGMLPYANQIKEDFQNLRNVNGSKYSVASQIFVSSDFSVAQKRERLFFLAIRDDIKNSKNIEPKDLFEEIIKNNQNNNKYVLKDALSDIKKLEAPRIKNMTEVDDHRTGKKVDLNFSKLHRNSYLNLINENRKSTYLFNHKARYVNDINYEIYKRLDEGEDGTSEKISDIMPYKHRNHIFKDKYFKLVADKPSRTITAHMKMDCHSHIHPSQIRSLTPREAARVQSFPDDYVFFGPYLKTYMQIGNAVPPLMARAFASVIKKYL